MTRARPRPTSARWRSLLRTSDRQLASWLLESVLSLRARRGELARWAELAALPEGEVLASPWGARMIALGLEVGATTVEHELRPLLAWHRSILPDDAVHDPRHGHWLRGALRTGKYEEFCAEDPFASYHPEHSAKWAPHEWLHRAVGVHARSDASPFARYLGARMNELLPVATWYGLEHALRLDHEGDFDRERERREPAAPVARARWLTESERSLRARAKAAIPFVRWTLERTARELAALDEELASGTFVPSPDAGRESFPGVRLDASTDAIAYVHAHRARLESPATSHALDVLSSENLPSIHGLRARIEHVLDRLLFAPLVLRASSVRLRIRANVLLDLLLRAALVDPSEPRRALVAEARALVARRALAAVSLARFATTLERSLAARVGPSRAAAVTARGLRAPLVSIDTRPLARGLRSVTPRTAHLLGPRGTRALVAELVSGGPARGHLAARVGQALTPTHPALASLAHLEHVMDAPEAQEPREGWRLSAREADDDAYVTLRRGVSLHRFAHDVLALHRGERAPDREITLAAATIEGQAVLCEIPDAVASVLSRAPSHRLGALARAIGAEVLEALDAIGLLVVLPAMPSRRVRSP
ncbi:MAG: hypothetical protein K1X94_00315 [Sandaracinaceae bacterium]|nr:hypothetical protein [Sandaracinaceae bacterium]